MAVQRSDEFFSSRQRLMTLAGFLPAIIACFVVIVAMWRIDRERVAQFNVDQRSMVEEQLASVGGRIATAVGGDIKLSRGLVSALSLNPEMTQDQYSAFASGLFDTRTNLRSVAAAPDFVITMVYPVEPNRKAIGLDYRARPDQRAAAIKVMQERQTVVTGPIDLVQGGKGLVIRYPVIRQDTGAEWGIVSSVLDVERLYQTTGLTALGETLDFALEKTEEGAAGQRFFSSGDVTGRSPVSVAIDLGYVHWTLSAVPRGGWPTTSRELTRSRLESGGIAICILLPLLWAGVLSRQRQRKTLALQQREAEMARLSGRLEMALSASSIGVWELDTVAGSLEWDARLRDIFSVASDRSEFSYEDWRRAVHPDDVGEAERLLRRTIEIGEVLNTQFRIVRPDGEIRHIRAIGNIYDTVNGLRVVGVNWDVTEDVLLNQALRDAKQHVEMQNSELRQARKNLEHLSLHDALTGLPNRRYLDQHLLSCEGYAEVGSVAVLHVDLDRFKEINDTLGHAAGDRLLVNVGERLLAALAPDEFAARVGGDEFVVVLRGIDPTLRARALAADIIARMSRPFSIEGIQCRIGCSVGLAIQSAADDTVQDLLVNADIALYEAKKLGKNRVEQFTDRLRLAAVHVRIVSDELVTGLERDEFLPFYQPQFDAHTLRIVGVEALARWNHPTRGLLPPGEFLSIANDLDRVGRIDEIMLEKGLAQLGEWRRLGLDIPKLSVNISLSRLQNRHLFTHLESLHFEPGSLSFELLESISFEDVGDELKEAIARLKRAHVGIEIDDFGTGHASIVNLLDLAPDRLKIDRKLVASVDASGARRRLVASIIEMGRALGIGTVAEGVETMQQAKILGDLGCDTLQGYALARPMSADDLYAFALQRQGLSSRASFAV